VASIDHDEVREKVCGLCESKAKPMCMEKGEKEWREGMWQGAGLTGAPAMAGRQTGHRGLFLG
jgi:hypothetical protein